MKRLLVLLTVITLGTIQFSCNKHETQNFDVPVSGRVYDKDSIGVGNVALRIWRGPSRALGGPDYNAYDTIVTDALGKYEYLAKYEKGISKKICCTVPAGYSGVVTECGDIILRVADSKTLSLTIDFTLFP